MIINKKESEQFLEKISKVQGKNLSIYVEIKWNDAHIIGPSEFNEGSDMKVAWEVVKGIIDENVEREYFKSKCITNDLSKNNSDRQNTVSQQKN